MYDQQIELLAVKKTADEYGDQKEEVISERVVFAEIKGVGQTEFYQAQAAGMKPEIKFVLPDHLEYQGETKIKYQSYGDVKERIYTVVRTFRKGNELEIVCKGDVG